MRIVNAFKPTMFTGLDYASVLEVARNWMADDENRGQVRLVSLVAVRREA